MKEKEEDTKEFNIEDLHKRIEVSFLELEEFIDKSLSQKKEINVFFDNVLNEIDSQINSLEKTIKKEK